MKMNFIAFIIALLQVTDVLAKEQAQHLRFAVISDLNGSYGSTRYANDVSKSIDYLINFSDQKIDLVLSTGDMVAGQKKGLNYKKMWNSFHSVVTTPLNNASIPFAPSAGNHDASVYSSYKEERAEYKKTFTQKSPPVLLNRISLLKGSNFPLYYAFVFKDALFIALDATNVGALSSTQMSWLKNTLKENRNAPLKVIFGHMPLYPYAFGRASEYMATSSSFGKSFENLLIEEKVNLFLSGHHHAYYSGTRKHNVNFVSVPLLGSGARKLLSSGSRTSEKGFLVFDYSPESGLKMNAIRASDYSRIEKDELPQAIRVPSSSSSSCKRCGQFPKELFIPKQGRTLYLRNNTIQ